MRFQNRSLPTRIRKIWAESVKFHGKACPLLALGVRVCDTALAKLDIKGAPRPDRLVCVSEHDGCCVDAIQTGLHCTVGKKHLLFYKTGRPIFTIYDLAGHHSVRICVREALAEQLPAMQPAKILTLAEDALFQFEEARPMTPRVEAKVRLACNAASEGIPPRFSGVQDCPDQFRRFDTPK